ncbi:MAG: hypothetical protein KJN76_01030 [Eudoraea sp.]|nr:hypothetical protein [Eudoraea sp.]
MKKTVYAIIVMGLLINGTLLGQATTRVDLPTEYVRNTTVGNNTLPENVQGSPYFPEGFVSGMVHTEKGDPYAAMLRYNGYNDQIEMKDMDKTISLLKRDYISATIGGKKYAIKKYKDKSSEKQGYFVVLNEGNLQLLIKQEKEFVEGKEANTSYGNKIPPKFVERTTYYLKNGEMAAVPTKLKKKDILKLLDNKKELVDFVNSNGLKLKSEAEVIELLNFGNQKI